MKKVSIIYYTIVLMVIFISCKKKADDVTTGNVSNGILVIENGSGKFEPGYTGTYNAYVVNDQGARVDVTGVTWSSSNTSAITVSGNTIKAAGVGVTTLTASVAYNGVTLTTAVPISVSLPTIFDVVPGVVLWNTDGGAINLTPVYIGTGNPGTYTYASSNTNIATVDANGVVTLQKAGECTITVTAPGLSGSPTVVVPVISVGKPSFVLPVSRISVTPSQTELFINDQLTFTAKAYNGNNEEVSTTYSWKLSNDTIASIDANGKLTALHPGTTKVIVSSSGIISEAEVFIYPHTVIEVTPYMSSIAPSKTKQFIAKTYTVNKSGNGFNLTLTTNPSDLKWEVPSFGISAFDIATVDNSGLVTMKSNATVGFISALAAYSPSNKDIEAGVALLEVSSCDCGSGTGVTSITPGQSSYSLSVLSSPSGQITATTSPAGLSLHYCSQDPSVVSVDNSGNITAVGPGTGTITICDGNVDTTVTVNVTM